MSMDNKQIYDLADYLCDRLSVDIRKIIKGEIRGLIVEEIETITYKDEKILEERLKNPLYLEGFGFKVYSQHEEDGMIEEIFNRIGETNRVFVEFGVQNGLESNAHYLLHKGWRGLWIEGSDKYCNEIERLFKKPISNGRLFVKNAFIDKDNINNLISENLCKVHDLSKEKEIDLLSIDIDGNDYWVWKAIECINPRVVVIEYNAKFPANFEWIMEYDAEHVWNGDDEMGASLKALELLGRELGYQLVGTDFCGGNAFFVRKDCIKEHQFVEPAISENLYNSPKYHIKFRNGHPSKKYVGK